MTLSLYRKYRPQKFTDVVGQNPIKTTLQNEIETGSLAHAYIFSGPRGCGKTTTARLMAKAVNCLNRKEDESEPCDKCESCEEIKSGSSLDLIEIDAASHTGVDNVRENIINNSRFTPIKRKYKVFIIDEVHMLSPSAFNALLKTLEEPPGYVIFILATTEIHKLPLTIISRCERFDFNKVNMDDLISRLQKMSKLEKVTIDKDILRLIASNADGCVRDAETLLGQVLSLGNKKITVEQAQMIIPYSNYHLAIELLEYISKKQSSQGIDFVNKLLYEGVAIPLFMDDVIECLRRVMLVKAGAENAGSSLGLTREHEKKLAGLASAFSMSDIIFMIHTLMDKREMMRSADIVQLPLEMAIIEICFRDSVVSSQPRDTQKQQDADMPGGGNVSEDKQKGLLEFHNVSKSAAAEQEMKPELELQDAAGAVDKKKTLLRLSMDSVKERWDEILTNIKSYNHALFSFLRANKPIAVKDNVIQIGVQYTFHKEIITSSKNRKILEKVFTEILGDKVIVECVMVEQRAEAKSEEDEEIQGIAEAFGGKLIE